MTTNFGPMLRTAWPARTRFSSPVSSRASLSLSTRPSIRWNKSQQLVALHVDPQVHRVGHHQRGRRHLVEHLHLHRRASRWPGTDNSHSRYCSGSTGSNVSKTFRCTSSVSRSFMLGMYLPRQRNVFPPRTICSPAVSMPRAAAARCARPANLRRRRPPAARGESSWPRTRKRPPSPPSTSRAARWAFRRYRRQPNRRPAATCDFTDLCDIETNVYQADSASRAAIIGRHGQCRKR